eukprot:gene12457-26206_t
MEHGADEAQFRQQAEVDFVIPLKRVGLVTRAVLEAVQHLYCPRRIVVVSARAELEILKRLSLYWAVNRLEYIAEEDYFLPNFKLTLDDILSEYGYGRGPDQREPGWWIQQLIKLGAGSQIPGISPVYVVWDGDLIPVRRWKICDKDLHGNPRYYIAILQQEARSEFNTSQYSACMKALTGLTSCDPIEGGTFVTHHMVFHSNLVKEMLDLMSSTTGSTLPWPKLIMSYSKIYYRFSEYKTYASFIQTKYPNVLQHHRLADFGEYGLRFRDAAGVVRTMLQSTTSHGGSCDIGLSYSQIFNYVQLNWKCLSLPTVPTHIPAYIQLDHVYGTYDEFVTETYSIPVTESVTVIDVAVTQTTGAAAAAAAVPFTRKRSLDTSSVEEFSSEISLKVAIDVCIIINNNNNVTDENQEDGDGYPIKLPFVRAR